MKTTIERIDRLYNGDEAFDVFSVKPHTDRFSTRWMVYIPDADAEVQIQLGIYSSKIPKFKAERTLTPQLFADWLGTTEDDLIGFITSDLKSIDFGN